MLRHYILKDKKPVEVPLMEWAQWFGNAERRIRVTNVAGNRVLRVSTIFTGIGGLAPVMGDELFETMIFGLDDRDDSQWRTSNWPDAIVTHAMAVRKAMVKAGGTPLITEEWPQKENYVGSIEPVSSRKSLVERRPKRDFDI